jgi:DNA repair exonuclease SbcCD ATPase subunit
MGLFKKRSEPAEIERLKADIESMSARLAASDAAKQQLDARVAGIVTRLDTPISPPPSEPPPAPAPPAPTIDPKQLDLLSAKLERLSERVDQAAKDAETSGLDEQLVDEPRVDPAEVAEIRTSLEQLTSRVAEVDARITAISVELANQISELSGDLESLGGNEPPTDEVVDELRDAQTRLASEQARYQIAFRQDLADLADRLKRS